MSVAVLLVALCIVSLPSSRSAPARPSAEFRIELDGKVRCGREKKKTAFATLTEARQDTSDCGQQAPFCRSFAGALRAAAAHRPPLASAHFRFGRGHFALKAAAEQRHIEWHWSGEGADRTTLALNGSLARASAPPTALRSALLALDAHATWANSLTVGTDAYVDVRGGATLRMAALVVNRTADGRLARPVLRASDNAVVYAASTRLSVRTHFHVVEASNALVGLVGVRLEGAQRADVTAALFRARLGARLRFYGGMLSTNSSLTSGALIEASTSEVLLRDLVVVDTPLLLVNATRGSTLTIKNVRIFRSGNNKDGFVAAQHSGVELSDVAIADSYGALRCDDSTIGIRDSQTDSGAANIACQSASGKPALCNVVLERTKGFRKCAD